MQHSSTKVKFSTSSPAWFSDLIRFIKIPSSSMDCCQSFFVLYSAFPHQQGFNGHCYFFCLLLDGNVKKGQALEPFKKSRIPTLQGYPKSFLVGGGQDKCVKLLFFSLSSSSFFLLVRNISTRSLTTFSRTMGETATSDSSQTPFKIGKCSLFRLPCKRS